MTNKNLENGMKKLRRKDLLDEAMDVTRNAFFKYGETDIVTVTNLLRLMDQFRATRTIEMTDDEWNAIRRYYTKKALGWIEQDEG